MKRSALAIVVSYVLPATVIVLVQLLGVWYWFGAAIFCGDAGDRVCIEGIISAIIVYIAPVVGGLLVYAVSRHWHKSLKLVLGVYAIEILLFIITGHITDIAFLFGI